jgi:CHAT domain-containing protein
MPKTLIAIAITVLSSGACAPEWNAPTDAQLAEAQAAFGEGERLIKGLQYKKAIQVLAHSLKLRESILGGNHLEVAKCLTILADAHRSNGEYAIAEQLLQRALAIREAALGQNHPDVASLLNSLAVLYIHKGNYMQAKPLLERALSIQEEALSMDHPDVAKTLGNFSLLYSYQGHYAQAESLAERALATRESSLGRNHLDVGYSLVALGSIYVYQGHYAKAEPLLERALGIFEATLGENHPGVAFALDHLARVHGYQERYSKAEPLLERSITLLEGSLGQSHLRLTYPLMGLAAYYIAQGQYARAKPLLERVLRIQEATIGQNHPDVAHTLINLADLYTRQGHYAQAEPLYMRVLTIEEAVLGKNHPNIAESLTSLALIRLAQQDITEALPLFERAFAISETHLRQQVFNHSEESLANLLKLLRTDEERLYALARMHPDNVLVRNLALTAALLRKSRALEEISATSRIIYRGLGPTDRKLFEQLRTLRTQLAGLSLAAPGSFLPADYQQQLRNLADKAAALEADIARRSAPLRTLHSLPQPSGLVDRVAAALPGNGALVEFVAYSSGSLDPKPGLPYLRNPRELRYLVLLLFPDGRTVARDLGPAVPIDIAAQSLHDALARPAATYQSAAQELYRLTLQPLEPHLGKVQRLFLAPDGNLAVVPFAALHDGRRFLVDSFDITYLDSGKDVLRQAEDIPPEDSVIVLADPDVGASHRGADFVGQAAPRKRPIPLKRFFPTLRAEVADMALQPLPGARQEAEAIKRFFPQAELLLGDEATKEALLRLPTPGILHIASHAFFLADDIPPVAARAVHYIGLPAYANLPQPLPNPLLGSGMILAGAPRLRAQASSLRPEDSLVTALELAGLNLWGTQLVVLSACHTGRGDIRLGQGVYGLRRALMVAGAETLVTSLWQVRDNETRQLMEAYYRNLREGQGRSSALSNAMRALRHKRAHPHFWAPFIAIGKDSPLQGLAPLNSKEPAQ